MDGVLINSEPYHSKVEFELMKEFGINLTDEIVEEFLGTTFDHYFSSMIKRFNLQISVDDMKKRHSELISKYYLEIFPPTLNVKYVLQELQTKGFRLALATGSPKNFATATLKRLELLDFFEQAIYSDDVLNGKPDPEPFLMAASKMNVKPEECIVVEDSLNGFRAAKAAKMKVIALRSQHNAYQDFSLADEVIIDLRQLLLV